MNEKKNKLISGRRGGGENGDSVLLKGRKDVLLQKKLAALLSKRAAKYHLQTAITPFAL